MQRRRLRYPAAALGIFCLLAMFKPGYTHDQFYLGLPSSPLFDYEEPSDRTTETPAGITRTVKLKSEWHVHPQSYSMLLGLAGIGFFFVAWRLHRFPR
jgi:hypothetical protein